MATADVPPEGPPLRLALLVDQFPELSETFIAEEARSLAAQGHHVRVEAASHAVRPAADAAAVSAAYGVDDSLPRRLFDLARLAGRHPLRCVRDLVERREWRREEPVRPLRSLATVARRVRRGRERHLHAHFAAGAALDAMRLGRLLDLPYSVATHGYDIFQRPQNLRLKHERAAFAVSDCEYSVEHLIRIVPEPHARRVHELVLGVDGEVFRRTTPYPGGRSVIAVARLVEKKGLRYLVEAAATLRRGGALDELVIVGEGPLRGELETLAWKLGAGKAVRLVGARQPAEVRRLMENADLLAMPCVVAADGDRDTMPVVVKEALALEIPVVATDEVGLPELVRPAWGRLVPPRDAGALAEAIGELLALAPEQRCEMGRAGRAWVLERCDLRAETAKLVRLVREAATAR